MPATLAEALSSFFATLKLRGLFKFTPETSVIEQELVDTLSQHSKAKWFQQVIFDTAFGKFYLDMGCRVDADRAIGIECDGREFHTDKLRDFCRDALIPGTGRLACIYRLEAWAVRKRPIDWLRILCELEPGLLTDSCVQAIRELSEAYDLVVGRKLQDRYMGFLSRRVPAMAAVQAVQAFAEQHEGITFPQLVERVRRKQEIFGRPTGYRTTARA